MAAPNFMFPQGGNVYGANPYQQALMQYQTNSMGQTQYTTFINVQSEEAARRCDIPPNTTANFINTNEGFIYIKTAGSSILEPGKFIKIRLVEETEEQANTTEEVAKPQVNLDDYITKSEFESKFKPFESTIAEMQEVVKELKG